MISAQAIIDKTATIGEGCSIAAGATLGPGVRVGDAVRIGEGAIIVNTVIGNGCEIGPGAILQGSPDAALRLESQVAVMAGSIVSTPIVIASGASVQAGAVVTRDVPPHAIVTGNPAQIVGYRTLPPTSDERVGRREAAPIEPALIQTRVRGVTMHRFPKILDLRGNLTVGEFGRTAPFEPKRYFIVFGVPNAEVRGEHAHRECQQFLICTHGQCSVLADDGQNREEFLLDDPSLGLYLPPLTWGVQYKYSSDAVLLVFASHYYDSAEYIRSYQEFRTLTSGNTHGDNA